MRFYRIALAELPYVAVLAALAASKHWYAFWVAVSVTLLTQAAVFAFLSAVRRDARRNLPSVQSSGPERARALVRKVFVRRWWIWGAASAAVGTAAFFSGLRKEGWWVVPVYAIGVFLTVGIAVRLAGVFAVKYEEEFERFTRHGSRTNRPPDAP